MKNQYGFKKLNIIIIVLAVIAAFSTESNASVKADRYKNAIVQSLTEKLRVDLSDSNVRVKLSDVRDNEVAKNRIDFNGNAFAVVIDDKTELPLQFTAQVDVDRQKVEDVSYRFVETESEFAPTLAEDNLMKSLMTQISKDFDTTNIVISIDGFETAQLTANETKYQGIGEVRIGDFEWRRINFNVVLDSQNATATKILYEVQNK